MSKKVRRRQLPSPPAPRRNGDLRIIGGSHRGRRFHYHGDPATRPMKERVREAIFNLVGPRVVGKLAIDLFAGTGALALEALSRGASAAVLIERHFPTLRIIRQNVEELAFQQPVRLLEGDAFFFARELPFDRELPWLVFCSPPYSFYVSRADDLLSLIGRFADAAPRDSLLIVESDERFDQQRLPCLAGWDRRLYRPTQIAIARLPWPPTEQDLASSGDAGNF